jgi:hypothetical protein
MIAEMAARSRQLKGTRDSKGVLIVRVDVQNEKGYKAYASANSMDAI